jgi:hypothetical protein
MPTPTNKNTTKTNNQTGTTKGNQTEELQRAIQKNGLRISNLTVRVCNIGGRSIKSSPLMDLPPNFL